MVAIGVSAERAVVIDEMPIWPSIVKGWKFLWGKFGDYFTIVLLLIGIAIVAGIVFACVLMPILCGVFGLGAASSINAFRQGGANILTGLFVLLGPTVLIVDIAGFAGRTWQCLHVQRVDTGLSRVEQTRAARRRDAGACRAADRADPSDRAAGHFQSTER